MKLSKWALSCAVTGLLCASSALAQAPLRQPASAQSVSYDASYYAQDDTVKSPSDKPAEQQAPADSGCGCGGVGDCGNGCGGVGDCGNGCGGVGDCGNGCGECDNCCGNGCGGCGWECCEHGEPCKLFDCGCSPWSINGWIAQGYTYNPDRPADRFNGPVTFNDRSNEYMVNQVYLYAEKTTETCGCGWDLGGRVDLLYGTDARFTTALGLDAEDDFSPAWNSSRFYGLAMPQAYAELAWNDWKFKMGHFYTPIGNEVVAATGNFFYSHAYTMQYGEPFTHTGILGTFKANDQLSLLVGVTRGWDNVDDPADGDALLLGSIFTSSDGSSSLAYILHAGDEFDAGGGASSRYVQSIVLSRQVNDCWKYIIQTDYGVQDNGSGGGAEDAEWYGLNTYLIRTINQCWSWGVRAEWFRDDDGVRVAPIGDSLGSNTASAGGFAGHFYETAIGINWKPNANWTFRPELRYDMYDGPDNGAGNQPYDDGSDDKQFLLGFDAIVTF